MTNSTENGFLTRIADLKASEIANKYGDLKMNRLNKEEFDKLTEGERVAEIKITAKKYESFCRVDRANTNICGTSSRLGEYLKAKKFPYLKVYLAAKLDRVNQKHFQIIESLGYEIIHSGGNVSHPIGFQLKSTQAKEPEFKGIMPCANVVTALKIAKKAVKWDKLYKHTQKLFIAVANRQLLAIGVNDDQYAIAHCKIDNDASFSVIVPVQKSEGKEYGFCPFMQALKERGTNTSDLTFEIDDQANLVVYGYDFKFSFKTLPLESSCFTDKVQSVIDEFMADKTNDVSENSDKDDKLIDAHIIGAQNNDIDDQAIAIETPIVDIDTVDTENNFIEVENTDIDIVSDTVKVAGIGDIKLISADQVQTGMYLSYNNTLYTVQSVAIVDFINSNEQVIITLNNLLNTANDYKILVASDDMIAAWYVVFKDESIRLDNKVDKREIKPIDIAIPSRKTQAKNDAGIKGENRDKLLKMVTDGCTLQDMMTAFNWSKKNAQNHTTYIKWWGYDLKREGNIYKLV